MKIKNIWLVLLWAEVVGSAVAQSYSVDWYKIAGGGGTSSGGSFSLSGTVGQSDASGAMTGGNYSLTGGFWSLYAVQTPGAPWLTLYLANASSATVAWPVAGSGGYVLQENMNLATTNWLDSVAPIATLNGTNQITVAPPTGNKFFRLYHP